MPDDNLQKSQPVTVNSGRLRDAREGLLKAEALLNYLKDPHASQSVNADVVVPALAEETLQHLSTALEAIE